MTAALARCPVIHQRAERQALYQVWIDLDFGEGDPDWWWNTAPKPLPAAVEESLECKRGGWVAIVLPDGVNPRPDGRWDNP